MLTQTEIDQQYVDGPEAARMLNVSNSRIRRLCLDGRFEGALKTGRAWLIPRKEVEEFQRGRPGKRVQEPTDREIAIYAINHASNL